MRIITFLSPEDLTVTAQACSQLRNISSREEVWRQLYTARCWKHIVAYTVQICEEALPTCTTCWTGFRSAAFNLACAASACAKMQG